MMDQMTSSISPNFPQCTGVDLSKHTRKRSQQRCISENLMFLAMDYGKAIFKQGLIFYAVLDKLLPDTMDHKLREKLNNIVVVVAPNTNQIVTCYKRPNAVHYINKKTKQLYRSA